MSVSHLFVPSTEMDYASILNFACNQVLISEPLEQMAYGLKKEVK